MKKYFTWSFWKNLFSKAKADDIPAGPVINPSEPIKIPVEETVGSILPTGIYIKSSIQAELSNTVATILRNIDKYVAVESQTSVPWMLIAGLHYRESSLNFKGVLHNGEYILGTGKKTKLVPAGRGPFSTWEEAAIDALGIKRTIFPPIWTDAAILEFAERFNGLGYRNKGIPSPYVWGGTNKYISGHYVADGKFSSSAVDRRLGVAAIIEGIRQELASE